MSVKVAVVLCSMAVAMAALGGCQPGKPAVLPPAVVGTNTPRSIATLPVLRGAKDRVGGLNDVLGGPRPVVLAFFTTWCPVSKPALDALERIASEYRDGVTVVAVGMDAESPEIARFVSEHGEHITFAVDRDASIAKEMSVPTMPMIFVLDGEGVVQYVHAGYHGDEDDAALHDEVGSLPRRALPEAPAPMLPEIGDAPRMIATNDQLENGALASGVALQVERLKAHAIQDLDDGLYVSARKRAELATSKAPADAEAWLILAAASTAQNEPDAARDAYGHCVSGAAGPRVSECIVLLATF